MTPAGTPVVSRLRTLLASGVSFARSDRPLRALAGRLFGGYVLAFHDLDAERFRELIAALQPDEPVHLGELVERAKRGKSTAGLFAITVDDGVGETVRALARVALEDCCPITFFLPTRYLDTRMPMPFQWLDALLASLPRMTISVGSGPVDLSTQMARSQFGRRVRALAYTRPMGEYWPLIRELVDHAVEEGWTSDRAALPPEPIGWEEVATLATHPEIRFESHGVTHTAVCALSVAELEDELRASGERIRECTGRPARHFCYPYGGPESIGLEAPRVVARHYDSAVTMSRGRLARRDPFLLPRIPLYQRDTPEIARLKLLTA